MTGCIRPETVDCLNPGDGGGQYDSSGGAGGRGNPQGSVCTGCVSNSLPQVRLVLYDYNVYFRYKHYVELVEPAGPRACIKCCDDPADCPTNKGECIRWQSSWNLLPCNLPGQWTYADVILLHTDTQGCPAVISGNYFNCG